MGRRFGDRYPVGLLIVTAACVILVLGFDLSAIASIGSAVALLIFAFITAAHFRVHRETGAALWVLIIAFVTTTAVLLTFIFTTLIHEPASMWALLAILVLSTLMDLGWKRRRDAQAARTGT